MAYGATRDVTAVSYRIHDVACGRLSQTQATYSAQPVTVS